MLPLIGLSNNFSKFLEKATSHLNLEPDWPTILNICDLIRQGDVSPKNALSAINKKITHDNPHTAGYGLLVLESCVKNCGSLIHDEVCTKQYMEQLKEIAKTTQQDSVRNKILELIQAWAYAFRDVPKYRAVQDTMRIMKAENFDFPQLQESDAMFTADNAPEWVDGEKCHRCRVNFGTFNRKHHCRACGQVFCAHCSAKTSTLPKYGIEKEVRVCNTCYDQVNKPVVTTTKETDLPAEYLTSSLAQQQQVPPRKTDEELREEEELQIALALSQSEAEHKEKEKKRVTSAIISNSSVFAKVNYSPPPSPSPSPSKVQEEEEVDPELAKYLNRQYWEQRHTALEEQSSRLNVTSPSAPNISSPMPQKVIAIKQQQNGEVDPEMKGFVDNLRSQVEIFVNRMKSDSSRGRSIAYDSSVQTLFMNITALHSKLLRYIQDQEDKRVYYEGLQDKLTQIKDARGALDALREEHRLALLREKQEAERKKQMQMAQKLEIMRKKKQEYLQYQRQLALTRIQEQEREMQMRQEQQKQQYKIASGYQSVSGFMGPPNQGSPVRQVPYSGADTSYSPLPGANPAQTVYGYPGPTGAYSVPSGYMIQHPHQPQLIDPSAMPDAKPNPSEDQTGQSQESLGRVTVSGPAMETFTHPQQMGGLTGPGGPVLPGQPGQPNQGQPGQAPLPGAAGIPVTSQPGGHLPGAAQPPTTHPGLMGPGAHLGTGPGQPQPQPGHILSQPGVQMLPNGQLFQRQQIIIGQGPPVGRPMPMLARMPPVHLGANMQMPGPGQIVMPTSNGPMQGPQQLTGPQQMQDPQQQLQGPQQLSGPQSLPDAQQLQGPQQLHGPQQLQGPQQQMQGPQQVPQQLQDPRQLQNPQLQGPQAIQGIPGANIPGMQGVRIPLTEQAVQLMQQQQRQQQMQQQQMQQQQQPQQLQQPQPQQQLQQPQQQQPQSQPQQQPMETPKLEEERKSPEVAELITFD